MYGLKSTVPDARDFALGAITTLPDLNELPPHFSFSPLIIKDQRGSDFCTAFMACGMSELQEGVELCPEWSFAKSKELSGDPEEWGQDIRTALKVHPKHGAVATTISPYSVKNKDTDFLRYIGNWPVLDKYAASHVKKSYVKVTGRFDHFDNIRTTLWKYRSAKRAVGTGVIWGWDRTTPTINTIPKTGEGHAMYIVGWKDDNHLIYVNSWGTDVGDKGRFYVHRDVVNFFVDAYGAYTFIDLEPTTVKYMIDNGITDRDSQIIALLKRTVTLLKQLLALKQRPV